MRLIKYIGIVMIFATAGVVGCVAGTVTQAVGQTPQTYTHPAFPGPHQVGMMELDLVDNARANRPVNTIIWYPSDVPSNAVKGTYNLVFTTLTSLNAYKNTPIKAGPFPVITFSHGLNTINYQSYETMEHWASHGYIVIATTHAGNDLAAKIQVPDATVGFGQTIVDRTGDLRFALDVVLAIFSTHANGNLVGAAGHSAGGWTALAQANGYTGFGNVIPADPRIDVVLAISPATALIPDDQLVSMTKPVMVFGGSVDTLLPPINNSSRLFNLPASDRTFRVDVDNSGHASPSNVCELRNALVAANPPPPQGVIDSVNLSASQACDQGILPSAYARGILNYFSTAFFNRVLRGDGGFANEDQYPYLKRGYADDYQVCYWREDDAQPTRGSGAGECLASQ